MGFVFSFAVLLVEIAVVLGILRRLVPRSRGAAFSKAYGLAWLLLAGGLFGVLIRQRVVYGSFTIDPCKLVLLSSWPSVILFVFPVLISVPVAMAFWTLIRTPLRALLGGYYPAFAVLIVLIGIGFAVAFARGDASVPTPCI